MGTRFSSFYQASMNKLTDLFTKMVAKPSLPLPDGPFQVGYVDVMTPGRPQEEEGSFFRLHYPAPAHTKLEPSSLPSWTDSATRLGLCEFVQKMAWNWPTWVNKSEFLLLPSLQNVFNPQVFLSSFNAGWKVVGKSLTIPVVAGAAMEPPQQVTGWPVVVFSHGMGCNRFVMSQLCYQLASQGVVVVAVEHRDGSGCGSYFVEEEGGAAIQVPHEEVLHNGEYERRNQQVNQRSSEIRRIIDVLAELQAGQPVVNVVDDVDSQNVDLKFLTSSLDLKNNLHLLGHSFGGSSALLAAWQDGRVQSTLVLDPWMFPLAEQEFKIDKPTVVVNTKKFLNENNIKTIKRAAGTGSTLKLKVERSGVHLSATDVPMMFPSKVLRRGLGFMDKVDPAEVMKATNQIVRDWLRANINC